MVQVDDYYLASDVDADAPGTVGIVEWSVEDGVAVDSAEIRFGLTPDFGMAAPVDMNEPDYRTLLLGMKPSRTYYFQVVVTSSGNTLTSNINAIQTGPATDLVIPHLDNINPGARDPGFLISTFVYDHMSDDFGPSVAFILDEDGEVVWWFVTDGRASRAIMSYDGKSMWLAPDRGAIGPGPLQRVSMDTLETETFDVGASHDVTAVDDDTIAYIDYGELGADGEQDCPSVFEMDQEGNTTEIFETSDLPGYENLSPQNWECHLNAINYYPTLGLYSVSDRNIDMFVIDRQGQVLMRLSDVAGIDYNPSDDWNHGNHLLSDGTDITGLVFFANHGGASDAAAVVEYSLEELAGGGWQGWESFRYEGTCGTGTFGCYSLTYGDVQRLTNGNTMVTYSNAREIHEVDASGNLLMDIKVDGRALDGLGYAKWRPTLYGPPPN